MGGIPYSLKGKRVWVAGHRGMVGSAIARRLGREDCQILTAARKELDLRRQENVEAWIAREKPDAIFCAAATVGGIQANRSRPAEFIYDNLSIETNVIHSAKNAGVGKLLFLGSSCVYPKMSPHPIPEEALLTGALEPTNEWYALAKIAGIKLCQAYRLQYGCDFISAQPANLYGPGDNFDLQSGHVLPALMAKAHQAKISGAATMKVWGSGTPRREFLHVDDLADALIHLMKEYSGDLQINVGAGADISIRDVARVMCGVVGFPGDLVFDTRMPDGAPRKLLDISRLTDLGWTPSIGLKEGLEATYAWYLENIALNPP